MAEASASYARLSQPFCCQFKYVGRGFVAKARLLGVLQQCLHNGVKARVSRQRRELERAERCQAGLVAEPRVALPFQERVDDVSVAC